MLDILLLLGAALVLGFFGGEAIEKLRSPHVVGFIIIGIIIGESGIGLIDGALVKQLDIISFMALAFIGFDVGGEMTLSVFQKLGRNILWITLFEAFGSFILVTIAVFLFTDKLYLALIFGGLATATAPAATIEVLREYRAHGPLTSTVFALVAIDDALAIILYSLGSAFAKTAITGLAPDIMNVLIEPAGEVIYSILLGGIIGILLHLYIRKLHNREELLIFSLSALLITSGAANTLGLSLILANMALGVVLINLSKSKKAFESTLKIAPPFYILFFVLVGARLEVSLLPGLGIFGGLYIVFRSIGKFAGAFLGARISSSKEVIAKYIGLTLLPQGGVAVGLSIQAFNEFQSFGEYGREIGFLAINIIAVTTIIFELLGPIFTRYALFRSGEAWQLDINSRSRNK